MRRRKKRAMMDRQMTIYSRQYCKVVDMPVCCSVRYIPLHGTLDRLYYDRCPHSLLVQRADGRVFTGRAGGPRLLQEGVQLDETRRDERHSTAQHRHQTQGQHGLEWSAEHLDKAGHAPSTDGASLHASIHTTHHTHHPARLNREAPPHPKSTLCPPEHAPWPREMPSN